MKKEVTIEQLKDYSIFVGVPMYGGQCSGMFCKSTNDLATMCAKYGIPLRFYYLTNESLVQRARNYIVDSFLQSDSTHLMFIDADISFNARDVLTLLAVNVSDPNRYNIVTAPYAKKTISWEKVKKAVDAGMAENPFDLAKYAGDFVFNAPPGTDSIKLDEPAEIMEAGTGFMMIPRTAFEKYEQAYPEYKYRPDHLRSDNFDGTREIMAYFDCEIDPESKRYLSEDYFFCRNARKIGITVHMCPWIELDHIGSYIYKGSLTHLAALGASPTADESSNKKHYNKKR